MNDESANIHRLQLQGTVTVDSRPTAVEFQAGDILSPNILPAAEAAGTTVVDAGLG